MTLTIPNVTMVDLQLFHARHFAASHIEPKTSNLDGAVEAEAEHNEDGDLGFYPDGVQRTLSDEQIRIFRHSELQRHKREKEMREEEKENAVTGALPVHEIKGKTSTAGVQADPENNCANDSSQQQPSNGETRRLIQYDDY